MFTLRKLARYGVFAVAAAAAAMPIVYVVYRERHAIKTWMLNIGRDEIRTPESRVIRSRFNDTPIPSVPEPKNHTHGDAAAKRSSASAFADVFGSVTGMEPFFVQQSTADQKNERSGSRTYYWAKDVQVQPSFSCQPKNAMNVLVDVDYYLDMEEFLCDQARPTLLYTLTPSSVAEPGEKGIAFTFNEGNKLHMKISGGNNFDHEIWDYGSDQLVVSQPRALGLKRKTVVYLIDRRCVDKHHSLVLLTPIGKWKGFFFSRLAALLEGTYLRRLRVVFGDFLRLYVMRSDGLYVSTGKVGSYSSVTVPVADDEAIGVTARISKVTLSAAQVESKLPQGVDHRAALILCEYHRTLARHTPNTVYPVDYGVRRYQFNPSTYDPDVKPGMVPFMPPFVDECYAPDMTLANEVKCVQGRITDIASGVKCTALLATLMQEFVELLVPRPHLLGPADFDEVYERQDRPSQQQILKEAESMGTCSKIVRMFLKREAYSEVKDPRPISQISGKSKLLYSRYMYVFAELIKQQHWYAFGRTPRETAQKVVHVAQRARKGVGNTDYSRFDGRVSAVFRDLERMCTMRAFRHQYHADLAEQQNSQFDCKAVSTSGVRYVTKMARNSGSPETAVFNSLCSAFTNYVAIRTEREGGKFPTPAEAWDRLGLYGGDDGITADLSAEAFTRAAEMVGQVVKVELVPRGSVGVKFLARIYGPGVWFGEPDSMCDIPRQISKLHATPSLPREVTPWNRLLEKCRGYYLSDRNTPVIGPIATTVLTLEALWRTNNGWEPATSPLRLIAEEETPHRRELRSWGSLASFDEQYPNDVHDWACDVLLRAMPGFDNARLSEFLGQALQHDRAWFLDNVPLCTEPKPVAPQSVPVVVRGDVVPAASPAPSKKGTRARNFAAKRKSVGTAGKAPAPSKGPRGDKPAKPSPKGRGK